MSQLLSERLIDMGGYDAGDWARDNLDALVDAIKALERIDSSYPPSQFFQHPDSLEASAIMSARTALARLLEALDG